MNKQHQNQVRIIGGSHRGRKIAFPSAEGLRPTADSVRERVFNWLGQDLTGKRVLDLFAGSGALGFEAASRRAREVVLVEQNRTVARQLQLNARALDLPALTVQAAEAMAFLQHKAQPFDVVFLDPPYAWRQWPALLAALAGSLAPDARVYAEAAKLPEWPPGWQVCREGKSGMSRFALLQYTPGNLRLADELP